MRTAGRAISRPQNLQAGAKLTRQIITGAGMESGMEARHMLNAAVENQRMQYEELNGQGSFTDEMAEAFREEISGHADGVFGVNLALVSASNMMMFPRLFGVGLNRGMQTARFIDTSKLSAKARQQLAKNLGVAEGALPKLVDAARGNTFGRMVGRTATSVVLYSAIWVMPCTKALWKKVCKERLAVQQRITFLRNMIHAESSRLLTMQKAF